jgi:hypothetical protein
MSSRVLGIQGNFAGQPPRASRNHPTVFGTISQLPSLAQKTGQRYKLSPTRKQGSGKKTIARILSVKLLFSAQ